jgi:prepilin-type N-terminal cleavage/methylation domain-containing protein
MTQVIHIDFDHCKGFQQWPIATFTTQSILNVNTLPMNSKTQPKESTLQKHPFNCLQESPLMKTFPASRPGTTASLRAFTLIELLVVVTIMVVIMSVGAPLATSLFGPANFNKNVAKVSNLLEQARQYAITQNTYVWVAFHQNAGTTSSLQDQVAIAVIASRDGTNFLGWSGIQSVPNDNLDLINKVEWVTATRLENIASVSAFANPDNRPSQTGVDLASGLDFRIRNLGGGSDLSFTRAIVFSPRGEAYVEDSPVAYTDLVLQPQRGKQKDANNYAIIQVNGLTGTTRVYRQ